MIGNFNMNEKDIKLFRIKLNQKYDEFEKLEKEIDVLILKRNHLLNEIESGVALLLKYK